MQIIFCKVFFNKYGQKKMSKEYNWDIRLSFYDVRTLIHFRRHIWTDTPAHWGWNTLNYHRIPFMRNLLGHRIAIISLHYLNFIVTLFKYDNFSFLWCNHIAFIASYNRKKWLSRFIYIYALSHDAFSSTLNVHMVGVNFSSSFDNVFW